MYTEESIEVFLKEQGRLYDEPVAETVEEAEEFLEDCMAVEVKNIKEVRKYLDEAGADVSGMSDEELEEACEVFTLPSNRYLQHSRIPHTKIPKTIPIKIHFTLLTGFVVTTAIEFFSSSSFSATYSLARYFLQ